MKHHGPASSLDPSREAARMQARQHTVRRHVGSRSDTWRITTDELGGLVAMHRDGTRRHITTEEEDQ